MRDFGATVTDRRVRELLEAHGIAWTARGAPAASPDEVAPERRGRTAIQPGPLESGQIGGPHERCELCSEDHLDELWIEVAPEGEGISRVTVDVTLRLCLEHRRRLIEALGRQDATGSPARA